MVGYWHKEADIMYSVGISLVIYEGIMGGCAQYILSKEYMEGIVCSGLGLGLGW